MVRTINILLRSIGSKDNNYQTLSGFQVTKSYLNIDKNTILKESQVKRRFILFPFIIIVVFVACQRPGDNHSQNGTKNLRERFDALYAEARKSYQAKAYGRYKEHIQRLLQIAPHHPSLMYNYASASALLHDNEEALKWLGRVIDVGGMLALSAETDSNFTGIFKNTKNKALLERVRQQLQPVHHSETAYIIKERDLIPEGVAYDQLKGDLYISSIYKRKIVKITRDGEIVNFTQEKQDGLLAVIGMEVDTDRRHLWVCSAFSGNSEILDIDEVKDKRSAVFQYDLETGRLIKKYALADTTDHLLNDLTIRSNGDVFITDTYSGDVYVISKAGKELSLFSEPAQFLYPNGITISDDGEDLFVADYTGIYKINLHSMHCTPLSHEENVTLVGIDGLAFYKNSLISHQGTSLGGICRYVLNPFQDRVISKKAIEILNPLFDFPTTGELAGDTYYYIANAQLRRFNPDGSIFPAEKLSDVHILKVNLKGIDH